MITGIAWDHRRCWGPLDASIEPYRRLTGEEVRWDRRSLYSFGEGDLGTYAENYDLVIYDHPFVGDARQRGWLLDLNALPHAGAESAFCRAMRSAPHGGPMPMGVASGVCPSIRRRRPPPGAPIFSTAMAWPCRNRSTISRRSPTARPPSAFRSAGRQSRPTSCARWSRSPRASASIRDTTRAASCRARPSKSAVDSSSCSHGSPIRSRASGTRSAASTIWRRTTTSPTCPTSSTT